MAILIVPAMLLSNPLVGADKDKDKDKDKDSDKPAAEKFIKITELAGKVMAVYEDKRKVRIQVSVPKLNPAGIMNLQRAQLSMATARTLPALIQARQQMMQAQNSLYTQSNVEVEVQAIDDVVVRTAHPREAFDEKGKIKKFTKAELKELKGDPKMPGFKAEFGDLSADQIIKVVIVRKKGTPAPKPKPQVKKKKGKDDDLEAADLGDDSPLVNMIMILADPPPSR
jgi:hypothetical protein